MTINGQLRYMLEQVAEALGPDLRERLVFVGGCTTALFVTDEVTLEGVRATDDVDLIVDLAGRAEWFQLQDRLRRKGFRESQEDEVICRMRLGGLKVDFMPDNEDVLGFSNRWYRKGLDTAKPYRLSDHLTIRVLEPALFLATKLEAYLGRGAGDLLTSRDMEDIFLVIDGRPEIVAEVHAADDDVRLFIASQFEAVVRLRDYEGALQSNVRGPQGRTDIVHDRIVALSRSGA